MNQLEEINQFIEEFNQSNNINFEIDTIRIEFEKQHKKELLLSLGKWNKINKNDKRIFIKLKKRLTIDEVTNAYQLENHSIYYYNKKDDTKKYRNAIMVIYGLKQYHKSPPPKSLITHIFNKLVQGTSKVLVNIDLCFDTKVKPNIQVLKKHLEVKQFITKDGVFTDTYYLNKINNSMIEKIVIYNKQLKNNLTFKVWRIEALILIPNIRALALPLNEFQDIINISKKEII